MDFAPFEIDSGPYANAGNVDRVRDMVVGQFPNYRHGEPLLVTQARLQRFVERPGISCHAGFIRTPWTEENMYLSVAHGVALPHKVFTLPDIHREQMASADEVSLAELLAKPGMRLGQPSRPFGPTLDGLIDGAQVRGAVVRRSSSRVGGALVEMLYRGRIDYFIDYNLFGPYLAELMPDKPLVMVDIAENRGQIVRGRVACSKNEASREFIRQVNEKLLRLRTVPAFFDRYVKTWVPEQDVPRLREEFATVLAEAPWTNVP